MEARWERDNKFVLIEKGLSVDHDGAHVYSVETNAFDSGPWPEGWARSVPCSDIERSHILFESVASWADENGYTMVG